MWSFPKFRGPIGRGCRRFAFKDMSGCADFRVSKLGAPSIGYYCNDEYVLHWRL